MTIKITVLCDGGGCSHEYEPNEQRLDAENEIEGELVGKGWGIDFTQEFHYCPSCTKIIKAEGGVIGD